ncbi:hypothetical protein D3C80_1275790 [compost metagenome]
MCSSFFRSELIAEKISVKPNKTAINEVGAIVESNAPQTAPIVVAISRKIPIRMLVIPSFT